MKTLKEIILEKLVLNKKNTIIYTLSKQQLKDIFTYCMCYLKEADLFKEYYVNWFEMERYSYYDIDWYDDEHKWISEYHGDNNVSDELLNYIDDIGDKLIEIQKLLIKNSFSFYSSVDCIQLLCKYFMIYIDEYIDNDTNINLTKINGIEFKLNNKTERLRFQDNLYFEKMLNINGIPEKIEELYQICLNIL